MKTASSEPTRRAQKPRPGTVQRPTLSFSRINAIWLGAAVVAILAGFALLGTGSMTIAPLLLIIGYCVLLPVGIIKK